MYLISIHWFYTSQLYWIFCNDFLECLGFSKYNMPSENRILPLPFWLRYLISLCWLFALVLVLSCFYCVRVFATLWTITGQAPLSMDSPGKNTGVGCHFLLQGIFLTQGLNPCLLPCRLSFTAEPTGKPSLPCTLADMSTSNVYFFALNHISSVYRKIRWN